MLYSATPNYRGLLKTYIRSHVVITSCVNGITSRGDYYILRQYYILRRNMRACLAPWGMSAQEHTFTFCQILFTSGGNYTLVTFILYTTMVTHSECEISQSWHTQFSSHGAFNLNRAVMPPQLFGQYTVTVTMTRCVLGNRVRA